MRLTLATIVALTVLLPPATVTVAAASGDRTLYLYHTHTRETGRFTFRRNGQFDQAVLKQLNIFLADWRTKQPTKMDPALFDLLWSVYNEVGGREPISIVSSYRAPETNAMLRKRSKGVAENSQHMTGKAIDFYIPGVNLTRLREVAMRHQVGGVGYYPTSGSPFVHLDTGSVRAWPRMTRAQLKKVFPDGRTLHLPTDGKPLSSEGRAYAEAEWKKCRIVPCNGGFSIGDSDAGATAVASLGPQEAPIPLPKPKTLYTGEAAAEILLASLDTAPAQRVVPTIGIAPMPLLRPDETAGGVTADGAPIPAQKSQQLFVATLYRPATGGGTALEALDGLGLPVPKARVLMSADTPMVTAYVDPAQDPKAEVALRMIIGRETTASVPVSTTLPPKHASETALLTASIGDSSLKALKGMFDLTFNALGSTAAPASMTSALASLAASRQPNDSIEARGIELVAPELDHVNDTLVHPVYMSTTHFAVLSEAEGYLDKGTELGPLTGRVAFLPEQSEAGFTHDRFLVQGPVVVAAP